MLVLFGVLFYILAYSAAHDVIVNYYIDSQEPYVDDYNVNYRRLIKFEQTLKFQDFLLDAAEILKGYSDKQLSEFAHIVDVKMRQHVNNYKTELFDNDTTKNFIHQKLRILRNSEPIEIRMELNKFQNMAEDGLLEAKDKQLIDFISNLYILKGIKLQQILDDLQASKNNTPGFDIGDVVNKTLNVLVFGFYSQMSAHVKKDMVQQVNSYASNHPSSNGIDTHWNTYYHTATKQGVVSNRMKRQANAIENNVKNVTVTGLKVNATNLEANLTAKQSAIKQLVKNVESMNTKVESNNKTYVKDIKSNYVLLTVGELINKSRIQSNAIVSQSSKGNNMKKVVPTQKKIKKAKAKADETESDESDSGEWVRVNPVKDTIVLDTTEMNTALFKATTLNAILNTNDTNNDILKQNEEYIMRMENNTVILEITNNTNNNMMHQENNEIKGRHRWKDGKRLKKRLRKKKRRGHFRHRNSTIPHSNLMTNFSTMLNDTLNAYDIEMRAHIDEFFERILTNVTTEVNQSTVIDTKEINQSTTQSNAAANSTQPKSPQEHGVNVTDITSLLTRRTYDQLAKAIQEYRRQNNHTNVTDSHTRRMYKDKLAKIILEGRQKGNSRRDGIVNKNGTETGEQEGIKINLKEDEEARLVNGAIIHGKKETLDKYLSGSKSKGQVIRRQISDDLIRDIINKYVSFGPKSTRRSTRSRRRTTRRRTTKRRRSTTRRRKTTPKDEYDNNYYIDVSVEIDGTTKRTTRKTRRTTRRTKKTTPSYDSYEDGNKSPNYDDISEQKDSNSAPYDGGDSDYSFDDAMLYDYSDITTRRTTRRTRTRSRTRTRTKRRSTTTRRRTTRRTKSRRTTRRSRYTTDALVDDKSTGKTNVIIVSEESRPTPPIITVDPDQIDISPNGGSNEATDGKTGIPSTSDKPDEIPDEIPEENPDEIPTEPPEYPDIEDPHTGLPDYTDIIHTVDDITDDLPEYTGDIIHPTGTVDDLPDGETAPVDDEDINPHPDEETVPDENHPPPDEGGDGQDDKPDPDNEMTTIVPEPDEIMTPPDEITTINPDDIITDHLIPDDIVTEPTDDIITDNIPPTDIVPPTIEGISSDHTNDDTELPDWTTIATDTDPTGTTIEGDIYTNPDQLHQNVTTNDGRYTIIITDDNIHIEVEIKTRTTSRTTPGANKLAQNVARSSTKDCELAKS